MSAMSLIFTKSRSEENWLGLLTLRCDRIDSYCPSILMVKYRQSHGFLPAFSAIRETKGQISQIDEVPCQAEVRILQKITLKVAIVLVIKFSKSFVDVESAVFRNRNERNLNLPYHRSSIVSLSEKKERPETNNSLY